MKNKAGRKKSIENPSYINFTVSSKLMQQFNQIHQYLQNQVWQKNDEIYTLLAIEQKSNETIAKAEVFMYLADLWLKNTPEHLLDTQAWQRQNQEDKNMLSAYISGELRYTLDVVIMQYLQNLVWQHKDLQNTKISRKTVMEQMVANAVRLGVIKI